MLLKTSEKSTAARHVRQKPTESGAAAQKMTVGCIVRRCLLVFGTALSVLLVALICIGMMLAHGPSTTMRNMLVLSAKQASATKWVPGLFLPKTTVEQIVEDSKKVNTDSIDASQYVQTENPDEWADAVQGMRLEFISKPKFKAYMILVKDPSKVKVGVSSDNFAGATRGIRVWEIAQRHGAIASINGGEFSDIGGTGKGGQPIGLTYSFGKMVWNDGHKRTFIGFDQNNRLICREGMTAKEADALGIRDAVSFQNGNVLIEQQGENIQLHYSDSDTGTAQRTAIAQRADGTVLMLVTDGRSASSIGATKNDVIDVLVEYGAVSAGMLDGGSSSMMYFKDYYDLYPVDKSKLDNFQQMGLVNSYKAFTNPRRLPTAFVVMGDAS